MVSGGIESSSTPGKTVSKPLFQRRWPLFLHHCSAMHQPPAVVEVIFLLSRVSLDYRVRVAHLVVAARSGGAGEWHAICNSN